MTFKRVAVVALMGVVLAAVPALAGRWVQIAGKWFYTPDVGTEVTIKSVPNPDSNPSRVIWTLTTDRFGVACRNHGGNFASEVVSVEQVNVTAVEPIDQNDIIDKKKGIAQVTGHIDTDALAYSESIQCQNSNWYVDPATVLVYEFTATSDVFAYSKKTEQYEFQNRESYTCRLSDTNASPLNLPAPLTPYICD